MRSKGILHHELISNLARKLWGHTAFDIDRGQFVVLKSWVGTELGTLARKVGALGIRLGGDGNIFPSGH
jgi:hypothetical protein